MDTITIRLPEQVTLDDLQRDISTDRTLDLEKGSDALVVHGNRTRLYVRIENADTVFIDYSDITLLKRAVELIANKASVTIDNDCGTVSPGDQFVARILAEPDWDWRLDK